MAEETKETSESVSSVEIVRTSKSTNVKVKAYAKDIFEAQANAEKVYNDLIVKYPEAEA